MTFNDLSHMSNWCMPATQAPLQYQDLPADRCVEGNPRVGFAELGRLGSCTVGVWEMTAGTGACTSSDMKADEFFIILSGSATVRFEDGSPDMSLKPGTVGRLKQGTAMVWTVTETLRKVFLA